MPYQPRALPNTVSFTDADGISAWNLLLNAEEIALTNLKPDTTTPVSKYKDYLTGVRVMGFFLKDFWDHRNFHQFGLIPYNYILQQIKSCHCSETLDTAQWSESDAALAYEKIFKLGTSYCYTLMYTIFQSRSNGGPESEEVSPYSSPRLSRSSFDKVQTHDTIDRMVSEDEKTKSDIRAITLFRDGYKCTITGGFDLTTCMEYPEFFAKVKEEGQQITGCKYAHLVFPDWSAQDDLDKYNRRPSMLKIFGLEETVKQLLGGDINRLSNIITLSLNLHPFFYQFYFWLEEVPGVLDTYDVIIPERVRALNFLSPSPAKRISFAVDPAAVAACQSRNVPLPELPSRDLIAIHSACARVAHLSGVNQLFCDSGVIFREEDSNWAELCTELLNNHVPQTGFQSSHDL